MILSVKSKTTLAGVIISLSTLIAYWNVQYNNLISYDDVKYLIENDHVRSGLSLDSIRWALTATYDANWFPLTWLSHMLDMSMFGSNPLGHHLENLFLHIINSLLLLCILTRLTGRIWCSAAVALLFALHPLHVESVAWAAERKDVLSTLFFFLTIRYYIVYSTQHASYPYWAAVFLYICGLASKPMLVSLPIVLLLLDYWPLRRINPDPAATDGSDPPTLSALLREKIPFVLLSIASCITTFIVQSNGGAVFDKSSQPFIDNLLHALVNYTTYLSMIFWPSNLATLYPYKHDLPVWMIVWAAILIFGLSLAAVVSRQQKPYAATGWFWFLVMTAPVSGLVRIGAHSVADRYTYIPSIGIFIVAVWLLSDILSGRRYGKVLAGLISVAVMIPLATATWKQTTYWKDSITLFKHDLDVTSNNWVAEGNLGAELLRKNLSRQALRHLQEAVKINPDSYIALFNIGLILKRQGDLLGSINAFRKTIKLNPEFIGAYFEAGKACYKIGDNNSAYEILAALSQVNRDKANDLKRCYVILGQMNSAAPSNHF